ncbi:protein of unknown function [Clostridium beijerinckii]|nr:protein of unknown function [Clostridium beijerinckii]
MFLQKRNLIKIKSMRVFYIKTINGFKEVLYGESTEEKIKSRYK